MAAAGLGTGYAPLAPGTFGTLVGIPVFLAASKLSWPFYLIFLFAFTLLAIPVCSRAERIFRMKDSPNIVIDEIAGFQYTMFFVSPTPAHVALGFLLFRVFDIFKVFPANRVEDLPEGSGVVLDDIIAGIYSNVVLQATIYVFKF